MTTATVTHIAFVKDERTETLLKNHEVNFTGPTVIKLVDIDRKTSRHNQAREQAINPEGVERYRQAMRNGDELPAIVVYKLNGKWIIIDGNNRDQAASDEKYEKCRAYIVDPNTPSETLVLMTVAANATNGMSVDKSWVLNNALYLVETGYSREAVSKALKVSVSAIEAHTRERMAGQRANQLRITNWNTMPIRVRQVIGRIRLDKPFVIVAEAAIATHVPYSADFGAIVTKINNATSEEESLEIATQWAIAITEHYKQNKRMGKQRATTNHGMGLLTGLGKVNAFNMGIFNATFATDDNRRILNERIDTALSNLFEMKCRLNGLESTEEVVLNLLDKVGEKE